MSRRVHPRRISRSDGVVLIPVLFLLAALLLVTAKATLSVQEFERLSAARAHHLHGEAKLHAGFAAPLPPTCSPHVGIFGDVSIERLLCMSQSSRSLLSQPVIDGRNIADAEIPRFDFISLLDDAPPCDPITGGSPSVSPAGWALSPRSARASTSCATPQEIRGHVIAHSNLASELPVTIRGGRIPVLLVSPGHITLRDLRIEGDLLVLAGGDIGIYSLLVPELHRVTLISATGQVTVRAIQGGGFYKLIAKDGVFFPARIPMGDNALLPPLLSTQSISFE